MSELFCEPAGASTVKHVIDNYTAGKIDEITDRIGLAKQQGHRWVVVKCNYDTPHEPDNVLGLVGSIGGFTLSLPDTRNLAYDLFYSAILPVLDHFQTRGYKVELRQYIGTCDIILRWV